MRASDATMGVSRVKMAAAETIVSWWKSAARAPFPGILPNSRTGAHADYSTQAVMAARNARHAAATVIQGAFARFMAAVRASWDEVLYVHVRCHETVATDALYRTVLAENLEAIHINLNWLEVPKLSLSRNSVIGRAFRGSEGASRNVFVVIGSHGCRRPRTQLPAASDCGAQADRFWPRVRSHRRLSRRRGSCYSRCYDCEASVRRVARLRTVHRRVLLDWRSVGTNLPGTRCRPTVHRRGACRDPLGRGARSRTSHERPRH